MESTNMTAIRPGHFENTTANTLLLFYAAGLLTICPMAEDWSAITKIPRTKKASMSSTKKT
jgi:hypothetical protein